MNVAPRFSLSSSTVRDVHQLNWWQQNDVILQIKTTAYRKAVNQWKDTMHKMLKFTAVFVTGTFLSGYSS
jgi:hypothetical protein